jgi:diaminopimelate decarboxylase
MDLPATGLPELEWKGGSLAYCGIPVAELAEKTHTPAFVFSEDKLKANFEAFQSAFAPPAPWRLRIAYSVKTAWEPRLLALLAGLGAEAEVACEHELALATRAGFRPGDIYLDGPAHTREAVDRAVSGKARFVKVDSFDQLRLVCQVAGQAHVCLRIRLPGSKLRGPAGMLEARFGMDEAELEQALSFLKDQPGMGLRGFAVHVGSQVTRPGEYAAGLKALARALSQASRRGFEPVEVNIGGGFPSPTLTPTSLGGILRAWMPGTDGGIPPVAAFGNAVVDALKSVELPPSVRELTLEPGRALVGNASVLLTRVVAAKKGWLVLDASHNFVPESLLFARRRFLPSNPDGDKPWSRVNLAGSTLSGGDVLALGARLPSCRAGDILVMMDAGAYTLSRANRFTTLVPPAFLLDGSGALTPLRRKETAEDVVRETESW